MPEPIRSLTIKLAAISEKFGHNPRRDYGQTDGTMAELVASICERGVLSPVLLRAADPLAMTWYVVAGHRRVVAARMAGLAEVPALCLGFRPRDQIRSDDLALALVENLHRRDMNPMERAEAFGRMAATGMTNAEIGQAIGQSGNNVRQYLLLLSLPDHVREAVRSGDLSVMQALELHKMLKAGKSEMAVNKFAAYCAKERMNTTEMRAAILADTSRRDVAPKAQATALAQHRELATWATERYGSVTKALARLRELEGSAS